MSDPTSSSVVDSKEGLKYHIFYRLSTFGVDHIDVLLEKATKVYEWVMKSEEPKE